MINYVIRGRRKSINDAKKYYPAMAPVVPLTLRDITEQIERQCTVSTPDIKAVLNVLEYVVVGALKNGQSVRLGDLGSFRPTICTKSGAGKDDPADVDASIVERVRCRYTQSAAIRRALRLDNVELRAYKPVDDGKPAKPGEGA